MAPWTKRHISNSSPEYLCGMMKSRLLAEWHTHSKHEKELSAVRQNWFGPRLDRLFHKNVYHELYHESILQMVSNVSINRRMTIGLAKT